MNTENIAAVRKALLEAQNDLDMARMDYVDVEAASRAATRIRRAQIKLQEAEAA